jgi:competence protein ComEC
MALSAMFFIVVLTLGWKSREVRVVGVVGLVMVSGAWRFHLAYKQNDLAQFYNQKLFVSGVISSEPDRRLDKTYLTLEKLNINNQNLDSKILISVPPYPEYEYGQYMEFEVKIQEPKEFEDFSYKNYLSRFGIDAVGYSPKVTKVDPPSWGLGTSLLKVKHQFIDVLNRSLPEPHSSFMAGLLLGAKRSIPEKIQEHFNATGTSHIVAISGYNITIIATGIGWALQQAGLRKRFSFLLAVVAILCFVFITGASSAVVRAGIMGILLLVALNIGRIYEVNNILAFCAVAMIAVNPQILHFDIGFQLSFTALIGIIYLTPVMELYFLRVPKYFREFLLASIAAQIFTLPLLLYYFGRVSLIAPIANILVLPIIPLAMLNGFLTGLLGLVWLQFALPFAFVSWSLLSYILKAVEVLASLPFASVNFSINAIILVGYYLVLGWVILKPWNKQRNK